MKLKPCPFCGSTDIEVRKIEYPKGVWYWVECRVCYAEIGEQQPKEKAIAVWNTRSNEEK